MESTKSVSDVYAPVSGTVSGRNELLETQPELVNTDPYGEGWMFEVTVSGPEAFEDLLSAAVTLTPWQALADLRIVATVTKTDTVLRLE